MSHLKKNKDGSITLVADRRLYSRDMVKRAAALVVDRCHVTLDLAPQGVEVTLSPVDDDDDDGLFHTAGHFGNLLVSELAHRRLDEQAHAARDLLVARALDGALPRSGDEVFELDAGRQPGGRSDES